MCVASKSDHALKKQASTAHRSQDRQGYEGKRGVDRHFTGIFNLPGLNVYPIPVGLEQPSPQRHHAASQELV